MKKFGFLIVILLTLLIHGISYCQENSPMKPGSVKLEDYDETKYPDLVKISFEEAMNIAMKALDGKVIEIELDRQEDYLVYEVEMVQNNGLIEILIDPATGEVLKVGPEVDKEEEDYEEIKTEHPMEPGSIKVEDYDEIKYPDLAKISFEEAMNIALKETDGKLIEIELEEQEEYLVFEVEIVTGEERIKEITIDAGNGKILKIGIEKNETDRIEETTTN